MQESYVKGVAIRPAPSLRCGTARCTAKRKQGHRWAGYWAPKTRESGTYQASGTTSQECVDLRFDVVGRRFSDADVRQVGASPKRRSLPA